MDYKKMGSRVYIRMDKGDESSAVFAESAANWL